MYNYTKERLKDRAKNKKVYREITENYNFQCALCGWNAPTPQGGCELHHIDSWKESKNSAKENLILLCPNCHKLADIGMVDKDTLRSYLVLSISENERMKRKLERNKRIYRQCMPQRNNE